MMHKINVWHEYSKSLQVLFYRCFHQQFCTLISYNSSTKCKALSDFLITIALHFKHFSSFWFKSSEFLTQVFLLFTEDMSMRILCPRNSSKLSPSTKQSKSDSCESSHWMILIYIVTVIESKVHTQVLIVDKAVNWIGYWQDTQDSAWPQQVPTDPGLGALAPEQSVRPGPRPGRDRQDHGQKGKVNSKVQIGNAISMIQ